VGSIYHYARGKWEGEFEVFKVCASCEKLRIELSSAECLIPFGCLFEELGEEAKERSAV